MNNVDIDRLRFKFRIWDKTIRKFGREGEYGFIYQYGLIHGNVKHPILDCYYNPDVVIQQCTGLKDKNDVEIYEGDIVEWENNFIGEMCWSKESVAFVLRSYTEGYSLVNETYKDRIKVIGNIFENKDLLNI